jgi:hypothetical protein
MSSSLLIEIITISNSNQELKDNDIALDICTALKYVFVNLFFTLFFIVIHILF